MKALFNVATPITPDTSGKLAATIAAGDMADLPTARAALLDDLAAIKLKTDQIVAGNTTLVQTPMLAGTLTIYRADTITVPFSNLGDLTDLTLDVMVKAGLLPAKERGNPETVRTAYGRLVVAALKGANNGLLRGI